MSAEIMSIHHHETPMKSLLNQVSNERVDVSQLDQLYQLNNYPFLTRSTVTPPTWICATKGVVPAGIPL